MSNLRFKEGDEAEVARYGSHVFPLGERVVIQEVYPDSPLEYKAISNDGTYWYIADEELQPISAPELNIREEYIKRSKTNSMDILYGEQKNTVETYTYTINQGGELDIKVSNDSSRIVSITFVNNVFQKAEHNIEGSFVGTKSHWYVLGAISAKIKELEDSYKARISDETLPF